MIIFFFKNTNKSSENYFNSFELMKKKIKSDNNFFFTIKKNNFTSSATADINNANFIIQHQIITNIGYICLVQDGVVIVNDLKNSQIKEEVLFFQRENFLNTDVYQILNKSVQKFDSYLKNVFPIFTYYYSMLFLAVMKFTVKLPDNPNTNNPNNTTNTSSTLDNIKNALRSSSNLFNKNKEKPTNPYDDVNLIKTATTIPFEKVNFLDFDANMVIFGLGGVGIASASIAGYYFYLKKQNKKIEEKLDQEILAVQNQQNYMHFKVANKRKAVDWAQQNAPNTIDFHTWKFIEASEDYDYFTIEMTYKIQRLNEMKERLKIMPFQLYETPDYITYTNEIKKAIINWTHENRDRMSNDDFRKFMKSYDKVFLEPNKSIYLFDELNFGDDLAIKLLFKKYPFLVDYQRLSRDSIEPNTYINMRPKALIKFEYDLESAVQTSPELAHLAKEYNENYCFFMLDAYPQFLDLLKKDYQLYTIYRGGVSNFSLKEDFIKTNILKPDRLRIPKTDIPKTDIPKTDIPKSLESNDFFFQVKTGLKWLISLFY